MTPQQKKYSEIAFKVVFSVFILYRVFSLDIFPVTSNDSVHYLTKAVTNTYYSNPIEIFQPRSYKYAGYPIYLSLWYNLAEFNPIDGLTLMALSQRILLAIGLLWLIFEVGIFSFLPALFLSSNNFLAQSNILYTEGMTMPLAIFYALSITKIFKMRNNKNALINLRFWFIWAVMSISYCLMFLTKINFVVFGLPLLSLAFSFGFNNFKVNISKTSICLPIVAVALLPLIYTFAVSYDNYQTYNSFSPVMGKERLQYWAVWTYVFKENPQNKKRPELAEFYDEGNPYTYMHNVERTCGGLRKYNCTIPALQKRKEDIIEKSNISLIAARSKLFLKGILGGGKTELGGIRNYILNANSRADYGFSRWNGNWYVRSKGLDKFLEVFNRGDTPSILRGIRRTPMTSGPYRVYQALLTVICFIAAIWFIVAKKIGLNHPVSYAAIAYLLIVIAIGIYMIDIWRLIIPAWTFFVISIFHALRQFLEEPDMPDLIQIIRGFIKTGEI